MSKKESDNLRFKLKKHENRSGKYSWKVYGYWPDGKRERSNFKHRGEALEHMSKIEKEAAGTALDYGLQRTSLTRSQLADAERAVKLSGGSPVVDIVTRYLAAEERTRKIAGMGLDQALNYFESHYRPEISEINVITAVERFLGSRNGIRAKTKQHYRVSTGLLLKKHPNDLVHHITVHDIENLLSKYYNPNTLKTYRRGLHAFFEWCVRHHYAVENPCKRLDPIPADTTPIAILSLDESKRLLRAAMQYQDGVMVSVVAIGLFAGLRPSEINDLKPKQIKRDYMVVDGGKLRRTLNRRVPIPAVLKDWLQAYPYQGIPAGLAYKQRALRKAVDAKRWVQDIVRHTSISFQLERDRDEAKTAFNCGTSREMINRSYRDVVEDEAEVAEYWKLTPDRIRAADITVTLPKKADCIKWPSDKALAKLVFEKPLSKIGPQIGVSDSAVRKRCLSRRIELPKNGYWQKRLSSG